MPADQRLDLFKVFAHAQPVVQVFLFLLIVLLIAAIVVWMGQLAPPRRGSPGAEALLSAILVSAPLFGLTAAAYGLLDMSIGVANVRPTPDLTMLAPGFAEASLCILLGLLGASLAAAFRAQLRFARPGTTAA